MKGIAQISHPNGGTILPAKSSYELELVLEHVAAYARRHGRVRLEVNRHQWLVTIRDGERTDACTTCREPLQGLTYQNGAGSLCAHCAKRAIQ